MQKMAEARNEMRAHLGHEQRQGEGGGDDEVTLQPRQFLVLHGLLGLQCHRAGKPERFIARLADGGFDVLKCCSSHHLDAGALGCQIGAGTYNALHRLDCLFHPADAGGAGHAGDADL